MYLLAFELDILVTLGDQNKSDGGGGIRVLWTYL